MYENLEYSLNANTARIARMINANTARIARITLPGRSSQYNGRKITGLMRRMLARECIPENEGVAGYVEAFRCVLSG